MAGLGHRVCCCGFGKLELNDFGWNICFPRWLLGTWHCFLVEQAYLRNGVSVTFLAEAFFLKNPNNKNPNQQTVVGIMVFSCFGLGFFVCFFLKKNVSSETPCPVIWFLLCSYNIPTSQLCFPPFLSYVFFQNLSLFPSLNPPIFFFFYSYLQYWSWSWRSHITTAISLSSSSFQYILSGPSSTKYSCPSLAECFCVFLITWINIYVIYSYTKPSLTSGRLPLKVNLSVKQTQICSCMI